MVGPQSPVQGDTPLTEERLSLAFGEIPVEFISRVSQEITLNHPNCIQDLPAELDQALQEPVGQLRMQDFLEAHHKISVIVSDKARKIPRLEMLDALHRELPHIPLSQFTIVIANGTHKPSKPEELGLPDEVIKRYKWVSPDSNNIKELVRVGRAPIKMKKFFWSVIGSEFKKSWEHKGESARNWLSALFKFNFDDLKAHLLGLLPVRLTLFFVTSCGVPIAINKTVVESDWVIALGQIKPHYFCGFTGGIKSVFPGVAAKYSIAFNHFMKIHTTATIGKVDGNIVRDDLESLTKHLPKITILNIVRGGDGKLHAAVSGDPILAHREGVRHCREFTTATFKVRSDIVVVSAGEPMGKSIFQLAKALVPACSVVKPGGTIIATGTCRDGIGGSTLIVNQVIFRNGIKNYLPKGVKIKLVSEAVATEVNKTFFSHSPSVQSALEEAFDNHGEDAHLSVIPEAGSIMVLQE